MRYTLEWSKPEIVTSRDGASKLTNTSGQITLEAPATKKAVRALKTLLGYTLDTRVRIVSTV